MLQDSIPLSTTVKANVFNMSTEEKARREVAIKNKDFFYDRAGKHLALVNEDMDPITINLTAPIVKKKINLLYSRPLIRQFDGPSPSVSFLTQLYAKIKIERFLRNVDLAAELTGTAAIFVGVDEEGQTYLQLYDASDFSVVEKEDDQEAADAISLVSVITKLTGNSRSKDATRTLDQQIWTEDYVTKFVNGSQRTQEANLLGYLPFVAFKGEEVYNQYLGHAPANAIVTMNQTLDQQLTHLGYTIKMQAATPIVLTGFERGEGLMVHPGRAISLPAGGTAEALQLNPKVADMLAVIDWIETKIYETSSIPKVSIVGDVESKSGRELLIKWAPLVQVFKDKASRYEDYELKLANMILQVNDMPLLNSLKVEYPEEKLLPLTNSIQDIVEEMSIGLTTPAEELQKRNPLLTDEEVEVEIATNISYNTGIQPKAPEVPVANNQPVDNTTVTE